MTTAEHHDTPRPEEEQRQTPLHILAVDDDLYLVEMIGFVIGDAAASFHPFDDPKKVLQLLGEQKKRREEGREGITYNVLFTDLEMPEIDGLSLAQKATTLIPDLTVVLFTGVDERAANYPSEETRKTHGISAMLQKPFSYEELHQKLTEVRLMKEETAPNL